jgi:hypothetical protein
MPDLVPRLPRVEALIGRRLADLDASVIEHIVEMRIREDADLDFKRDVYEQSDKGHRDAAGDVAAMANSPGGGAILLGIRDDDSAASEIVPIVFSDTVEGRLTQAIVSLTAPAPLFVIRRVPVNADSDRGVYVIIVPPSPYAPHAVRSGSRQLGYPRRSGPHTRWLSESEVAEAYRIRFVTGEERRARIELVREAGEGMLSRGAVWLATTLVPAVPGSFTVNQQSMGEVRTGSARWFQPGYAQHVFTDHFRAEAGVRRVVLSAGRQAGVHGSQSGHAEMHVDGSAFAAAAVAKVEQPEGKHAAASVDDEFLVEAAIATVGLCAEFAGERSGAVGDAYIAMSIAPGNAAELVLTHTRFQGLRQPFEGAHSAFGNHVSASYINLEDAATALGRLVVARTLLTEILQWFGVPEVLQITEDGQLRRRFIGDYNRVSAEAWATANGVDMVDSIPG